ncbi:hypothetical protein HPB51_025984 [Rhipicephalus microplus]|uniref:24 kDa family member n=1 Tax=Rhipicephalus microplus TaxID=6941 RepID=A0A9J6EDG7_RHIMP|nr:uncharacterized protein LOC119163375 [Rhipicephalus microplus]KAH8032531.1 hypothetical protein HPB51_025984 [Rhipicephalus microplus]
MARHRLWGRFCGAASDRTTRSRDAAGTGRSGSCQNGEVSECVSKLDLLSQNQSLAFATTEAELKRVCSHLTGALDCVNAFTRRCFNEKQQDVYKRLTSGAAQLIEDFCREGSPFRLTYLKHSKCYKELQDDYNKCASIYVAQRAETQVQTMSAQDKIRNSCCQMDGYKQCAKTAVLRHCDVEAAELAEDIIVKAGGYLVTTHCSGYRIDEPSCRGCSARVAIALSATVAVMAGLHLLPRTL